MFESNAKKMSTRTLRANEHSVVLIVNMRGLMPTVWSDVQRSADESVTPSGEAIRNAECPSLCYLYKGCVYVNHIEKAKCGDELRLEAKIVSSPPSWSHAKMMERT